MVRPRRGIEILPGLIRRIRKAYDVVDVFLCAMTVTTKMRLEWHLDGTLTMS